MTSDARRPIILPFHLFLVLSLSLLCFILAVLFHQTQVDVSLARLFYIGGAKWLYQDSFWTETILHKGGMKLIIIGFSIYILKFIYELYQKKLTREQKVEKIYFLLTYILTVTVIGLLKKQTTLPCPWHVKEFDGPRDFQAIWTLFNSLYPKGNCFPAGHASAGYGLFVLYFAKSLYQRSSLKYLLPGLTLGLIFGISQQFRGAHFLSHDLITVTLCLLLPLTVTYTLHFLRKR